MTAASSLIVRRTYILATVLISAFLGDSGLVTASRTIELTAKSSWCGIECSAGAKLEFINDHFLAVSFIRPAAASSGEPKDRDIFTALFFDSETGQLKGTLDWPVKSGFRTTSPQLLASNHGRFIVRPDGGRLISYSSDLRILKEASFPGEATGYWWLEIVPSHNLGFLASGPGAPDRFVQTWIDVDTFSIVATMDGLYQLYDPAAEDVIAVNDWDKNPPFRKFVLLREREVPAQILAYDYNSRMFITDDAILVTNAQGFAVLNRKGSVLFSGNLNYKGQPTLNLARSAVGNRFAILDFSKAIPIFQKKSFFDWKFTAKVYDMKAKGQVAAISLGTHDARMVALALSR